MVSGERDETGSDSSSAVSLARILQTLKRRGSTLLVVGLTSEEEQGQACRRMLGDDTAGPRRRLLVLTGADREALTGRAQRVQRPSPETMRYLTHAATTRSASEGSDGEGERSEERIGAGGETEEGEDSGAHSRSRRVEGEGLVELGDAIEAEIDAIETENGDLAPAELRVCIDSATPLLDAYDRTAVRRFLEQVTTRITAARGMGHVHLPVARDWEAVADLEGLFDAVVELRVEQGRAQQRWHLEEAGVTSDWFGV